MNPPVPFTAFDYILTGICVLACIYWAMLDRDAKRWKNKSSTKPYVTKGDE